MHHGPRASISARVPAHDQRVVTRRPAIKPLCCLRRRKTALLPAGREILPPRCRGTKMGLSRGSVTLRHLVRRQRRPGSAKRVHPPDLTICLLATAYPVSCAGVFPGVGRPATCATRQRHRFDGSVQDDAPGSRPARLPAPSGPGGHEIVSVDLGVAGRGYSPSKRGHPSPALHRGVFDLLFRRTRSQINLPRGAPAPRGGNGSRDRVSEAHDEPHEHDRARAAGEPSARYRVGARA
jgi:hypothetical protein